MLRPLPRPVLVACLAGGLAACGLPDGTLDLLPSTAVGAGGSGGSGGGGGSGGAAGSGGGGGGCSRNAECEPPTPTCIPSTGECVACAPGLTLCGGECVDTERDPDHCGRCFLGCLHNQACLEHACHCLPPMQLCNGACIDFGSDPDHCGGCTGPGTVCLAGESCDVGHCTPAGCSAGLTPCPAPSDRFACANLALGYPRCGSCDHTCGPSEVCADAACREYLPATPCTTCPCDDACGAAFGEPVTCCPTLFGTAFVACVAGEACP